GCVTLTDLSQLVDPRVSTRPPFESRTNLMEEPVSDLLAGEDGQATAKVVQIPAGFCPRDKLLKVGLNLFGLWKAWLGLVALQDRSGQVTQEHPAMLGRSFELTAGFLVTHDFPSSFEWHVHSQVESDFVELRSDFFERRLAKVPDV